MKPKLDTVPDNLPQEKGGPRRTDPSGEDVPMKADRSSEGLPLASLPLHERGALRNRLLEVLEEASQAKREGNYKTLDKLLNWLRTQASEADGWPLALIEVALQAVETLAGTSLPPEEMALRTFVEHGGEFALGLLGRLARFEVVTQAERQALPAEDLPLWEKLEDLGVVIPAVGGFVLNRRSHALARDLVEPPVLKAWRHVQECRSQTASVTPAPEDGAAARFMEVKIGLTPGQARAHLRSYPLFSKESSWGILSPLLGQDPMMSEEEILEHLSEENIQIALTPRSDE